MQADRAFEAAREQRDLVLRDARRGLILTGAWTVFGRDGLDGATMRAIAAASGCTTGAIYPLFASKEAIYAALLGESLARLEAAVTEADARHGEAAAALRAGALAFLAYYRERPDEVALGLYLWNGVRPRGLSRELDAALNARLQGSLAVLETRLATLGRLAPAAARLECTALFAFLIGALVVHGTGRLRVLGPGIDDIAALQVDALIARLSLASRPASRRPRPS